MEKKKSAKKYIIWEYNIRPPFSNLRRNINEEIIFGDKYEIANTFATNLEAALALYNAYWLFFLIICIFSILLIGDPLKRATFSIFGLIALFIYYLLLLLFHWVAIKSIINKYNKRFDGVSISTGPPHIRFLYVSYRISFS